MVKNILIVAFGGGVGSALRYLVSITVQKNMGVTFPWGTLVVNLIGCLVIGILYALADKGSIMGAEVRLLLSVGLCGGFTTFSTFAGENFVMLRNGEVLHVALYSGVSVFLGIFLVFIGYTSVINLIR
jgi:fluoride exporter